MNDQNYSMTDIVNLVGEVREMVSFQNSLAWHSECFTFDFQQEFIKVLFDKTNELEEFINHIEFKADFKPQLPENSNEIQLASNH